MFFLDGTSNRVVDPEYVRPTNVFRLNRAFTFGFNGVPQIAFYFSGVGTRGDTLSAVTGSGFDQIIIDAFINLATNYLDGDQVYLFGFSRGAAAARALGDLVSFCGVDFGEAINNFPKIWSSFLGGRLSVEEKQIANDQTSRPLVRFLGAFDAVPGLYWDICKRFTSVRSDAPLASCVECAVQILAIDDDRNPSFSPALWKKEGDSAAKLEQIWMPGVHADIGGASSGRFLSDVSLLTMIHRLKKYCPELEWDDDYVDKLGIGLMEGAPEITWERPGVVRKFLLRKDRNIPSDKDNYRHPICDTLLNREILYKGSRRRYQPRNLNRTLPVLDIEDDFLQNAWDETVLRG
jgi:uncharacterized protein (DUF2235 family)